MTFLEGGGGIVGVGVGVGVSVGVGVGTGVAVGVGVGTGVEVGLAVGTGREVGTGDGVELRPAAGVELLESEGEADSGVCWHDVMAIAPTSAMVISAPVIRFNRIGLQPIFWILV
ncbi:MAG: hypothetical protein H8D69_01695 [Chloroflexi bacterium]|nr:hypothetical protein [Chloroflexota bacterium]